MQTRKDGALSTDHDNGQPLPEASGCGLGHVHSENRSADLGPADLANEAVKISIDPSRAIDWTALMVRAQDGDSAAYRMLLEEITPYLRSLTRHLYDGPSDPEDILQDTLQTLHSVRQTYDPSRSFEPWLVSLARHCVNTRLRQNGRRNAVSRSFVSTTGLLRAAVISIASSKAVTRYISGPRKARLSR